MSTGKASRSCVSCYTYDDTKKGTILTPCCGRFVCGHCARRNERLTETCILCQLPIPHDIASTVQEDLPNYEEGLPDYDGSTSRHDGYYVNRDVKNRDEGYEGEPSYKEIGVQHYVRKEDSISSLSLAYNVEPSLIRRANHIFQDGLLQARLFVLIPGASVSLSAAPGEDEEKKVKLKRFMTAVKCTDYDMAKSISSSSWEKDCADVLAYMNECDYVLTSAVQRFQADSYWTKTHARDLQRSTPAASGSRVSR